MSKRVHNHKGGMSKHKHATARRQLPKRRARRVTLPILDPSPSLFAQILHKALGGNIA